MTDDSLRVALISETLEADSPQRRKAARLLLDAARGCATLGERHVEAVRLRAGPSVAQEARILIDRHAGGGQIPSSPR